MVVNVESAFNQRLKHLDICDGVQIFSFDSSNAQRPLSLFVPDTLDDHRRRLIMRAADAAIPNKHSRVADGADVFMGINFSRSPRVDTDPRPTTVFHLQNVREMSETDDNGWDAFARALRRGYISALIEERTAMRRKTVDLFLKSERGADFWPNFANQIVQDVAPCRETMILSSDNFRGRSWILYPNNIYKDGQLQQSNTIVINHKAHAAIGRAIETRQPVRVKDGSKDGILGNMTAQPDYRPSRIYYFPLLKQIANKTSAFVEGGLVPTQRDVPIKADEARVGGVLKLADPLYSRADKSVVRALCWEDEFVLDFMAEVAAVIMNNYFYRFARRTEFARMTHGFESQLKAIEANARTATAEVKAVDLFLKQSMTPGRASVSVNLSNARNLSEDSEGIASELYSQIEAQKLADRLFELEEERFSNERQGTQDLVDEVLTPVFRVGESMRKRLKRPFVKYPAFKNTPLVYLPALNGEPEYLRLIFRNLMENSIKYYRASEPQIEIDLTVKSMLGEFVTLEYDDNGMGILADEREHVFIESWRSERAEQMDAIGGGLGLFQARQAARMCGGDIECSEIAGKNGGAHFTIKLKKGLRSGGVGR